MPSRVETGTFCPAAANCPATREHHFSGQQSVSASLEAGLLERSTPRSRQPAGSSVARRARQPSGKETPTRSSRCDRELMGDGHRALLVRVALLALRTVRAQLTELQDSLEREGECSTRTRAGHNAPAVLTTVEFQLESRNTL